MNDWSRIRRGLYLRLTPHGRTLRAWYANGGDQRYLLGHELPPNPIIVEVGGFLGDWAAAAIDRHGGHLHVFEPVEEFADRLKRRFAADARVRVHACGLGATTRTTRIVVKGDESTAVTGNGHGSLARITSAGEFFECTDLHRVDLLSINAEGAEYELLPHLIETRLIERVQALQVQMHHNYPGARATARCIRQQLARTHAPTFSFPFVWEGWARRPG